jgi:dolichyl-phosphate-mannose--protein O-mannosyl transferase
MPNFLKSTRAKTALVIYLFAQIFFLINIQFPVKPNFDEFHYVPAAKEFISLGRVPNTEHPPLGKIFMAIGIATFGDRPIGWRVMSTVFGALSLVGMYFWALAIFKEEKYARWVVALTLVNQLLYVQSRIGMLDTFMFGFLVWALAFFSMAWDSTIELKQVKKYFRIAGILFGLATACKWFALIPWLTCGGLCLFVLLLRDWGVTFTSKKDVAVDQEFYNSNLWKGLRVRDLVMYFGVWPLFSYFITFVPYMFFDENTISITDFVALQWRMYQDQLRVVNSHPYMSQWTDWPLIKRPIWYAFDSEPGGNIRGVLLIGNPFVMWTGLIGVAVCLWAFIRFRSREAFLIFTFYFTFIASWILIPRKISFYYYYYPAGMTLSLALAFVFFHLEKSKEASQKTVTLSRWAFFGISAILFIYFFPILAALKIGPGEFNQWMWFRSWI